MKRLNKIIFSFLIFAFPKVVFATDYIVCGDDRRFPLVFADMFSILITVVKIIVPILLVISGMISFLKVTFSSNVDEDMKKAKDKLINSIIAAVIIFFVVSIVNSVISFVVGKNNDVQSCIKCFIEPDSCVHEDSSGFRLCPGFMDDQSKYDENCNLIEPSSTHSSSSTSNSNTNNSNSDEVSSFDNFLFIGDSRYVGISSQLEALGSNVTVAASVGAGASTWIKNMNDNYSFPQSVSGISVMLGVNETNADKMMGLLEKLHSKYPNSIIYVNSVYHIGKAYTSGYVDNNQIDSFNNRIMSYCSNYSWLRYVDVTSGLYSSDSFLNSSYTSDGLHMNNTGNSILIENIKNSILSSN